MAVMTTLKAVAIALTIASFVGARPCAAQRLAYADALARATANTSTPSGHEYEATKFAPYHQEHDAKALQICFGRVPNPDPAPFTFIIVLDAKGKPQDVYLDRYTNIAACFRAAVLREIFPPPPFAPFYEAVDMTFSQ